MISRHWRGLARRDRAQNYVEHLRNVTFPSLRSLAGFIGASILSRESGDGTEFLVITRWRALEDITRFSGADPEAAVVPAEVAQMMIDFDHRASHYDVVE
jgi:heme-degrading monooxygenase HmoA